MTRKRSAAYSDAWPAILLIAQAAAASAETGRTLKLSCSGEIGMEFGSTAAQPSPKLAFRATLTFGDGDFIALANPETGKVDQLIYGSETVTGLFERQDGAVETMVWTRATSLKGRLIGHAIGSDGEVLALTIRAAPTGSAERPFALFETATGRTYRGSCQ